MGVGIVKFPSPSTGGGGAVWGAITGTVSAQTDLYNVYLQWLNSITNNIYDRFGSHTVAGNRNLVQGNSNTTDLTSSHNLLTGSTNNVNGSYNFVKAQNTNLTNASTNNIVFGFGNTLNNSNYNIFNGNSGNLRNTNNSIFLGTNIASTAAAKQSIAVFGNTNTILQNNNSITAGNSNSVQGSFNFTMGSFNTHDVGANGNYANGSTNFIGGTNLMINGSINTIQGVKNFINGDNVTAPSAAINNFINGNKIGVNGSTYNIINLRDLGGVGNSFIAGFGNIVNSNSKFTSAVASAGNMINNYNSVNTGNFNATNSIANSLFLNGVTYLNRTIYNGDGNEGSSYNDCVINSTGNTLTAGITKSIISSDACTLSGGSRNLFSEYLSTVSSVNTSILGGNQQNIYSTLTRCAIFGSNLSTITNRTGAVALGVTSRNSFLYDNFTYAEGLELFDNAKSLILTAPIGTRYRVQVDNTGALTTTLI